MTKAAATKDKKTTPISMLSLNKWNMWLAGLHAVQGVLILLFSTTRVFPVQTSYLTPDPAASDMAGHTVLNTATRHLFDVNMALLVAIFFFISAAAHASIAWWYRPQYEADLKKKINKIRWIEYALSASVMMVAIALLSGVAELSVLVAIFVLDAIMNLCGLGMEVYNQGKAKPNWLAYAVGVIAGATPWVIFAVYIWGATVYGSGNIPTFVYWIYLTMFVLFGSFAVNMYLQYKKVGQWKDYLYGERVYMILSLVAKTLLAWQVFAGALRP